LALRQKGPLGSVWHSQTWPVAVSIFQALAVAPAPVGHFRPQYHWASVFQ